MKDAFVEIGAHQFYSVLLSLRENRHNVIAMVLVHNRIELAIAIGGARNVPLLAKVD